MGAGVRLDQAPVYSDLVLRCPGTRSWARWEDYLLTEKQLLGRVTLTSLCLFPHRKMRISTYLLGRGCCGGLMSSHALCVTIMS